jgi:hypothetical protein
VLSSDDQIAELKDHVEKINYHVSLPKPSKQYACGKCPINFSLSLHSETLTLLRLRQTEVCRTAGIIRQKSRRVRQTSVVARGPKERIAETGDKLKFERPLLPFYFCLDYDAACSNQFPSQEKANESKSGNH